MIKKQLLTVVLAFVFLASGSVPSAGEGGVNLRKGDRIAFVGNSLAERTHLYGNLEAHLHLRYPQLELHVRNFGWPADEVGLQQRPNDYTKLDDPLEVFRPNVLFCFFGYNESFSGKQGLARFEKEYLRYLESLGERFGSDNEPIRLVLVSPIAFEPPHSPHLPDGEEHNEQLYAYSAAVERVADKVGAAFVDLYEPTNDLFREQPGLQWTINGAHLNLEGDRLVAGLMDNALWGASDSKINTDSENYEAVRNAAVDLQWHHQQDYRMVNGWYVYGGRSHPFGVVNFPDEYQKIRKMVADRDRVVWALAQGKPAPVVDDSDPGLEETPTTFGTKQYSEPAELRILSPSEAEKALTVAEGCRVQTFASEVEFPELANPVQMKFDNRGRLWAACMPTYPQWLPGGPKPTDRLLIFEDTDNDGKADSVQVFADNLHCPTGFEFFDDGVLVVSQPRLLFLKDTDGDDRADQQEVVFDGFATDDTHHAIGAFEWTPDGRLVMLEGVSMSTTVETPWGPFRNHNRSVAYALDPLKQELKVHVSPCFANPWCYTHNTWGQGFVGDGTGANQHWATPLTGAVFAGRRSNQQFIDYTGVRLRPALGNGFVYSRHFPDHMQGNFFFCCVINLNGIPQFEVEDDGAGYRGVRIEDLVTSTDRNFRPGCAQVGPDGAIYFVDWHNPLIGHMQYSQRDPNRDHRHGRIYRLYVPDRPLVEPVLQAGKTIPDLLDQLGVYEERTRYRVRRELRARPTAEVVEAIKEFVGLLDHDHPQRDRLLTETLWVLQGHHVVDRSLLTKVLQAKTPDARSAGVHAVADLRNQLTDALELIAPFVHDENPRVRLEALRALSFFPTVESCRYALDVLAHPMDEEMQYTLDSTLTALRPVWQNQPEFFDSSSQSAQLLRLLESDTQIGEQARGILKRLAAAREDPPSRSRLTALLTTLTSNPDRGAAVFKRSCQACHRVGTEGAEFGPNLSDVGKRLKSEEIVDSLLFPNEKIEPKYRATNVITMEGQTLTGLVVKENEEGIQLLLRDGKLKPIPFDNIDEREEINVSSMPEGLHESMSGIEFVDLLTYLRRQKDSPE